MAATRRLVAGVSGERLDVFVSRQCTDLSRSQVKRLIEQGHVTLNNHSAKPAVHLKEGDVLVVTVPPPEAVDLAPEPIPLEVVYQDSDLLVVDKPAGLTVHPAPGHPSGTLVNALLALCPDLQGIGGEMRPGIVHRLDKDTSGLIVVAKSQASHNSLSRQMKDRTITKAYTALTEGRLQRQEGEIVAPIGRNPRYRKRMAVVPGGKEAITYYKVVQYLGSHTLVEVFPKTGRTHQIRVHFAHIGHPLVGDWVYGRRSSLVGRHFLHARRLGFRLPSTGEYVEFTSPLPADLQEALASLGAAVPTS